MLYLEDYLEMIEHLPQELKDRFTEIRELDLEVQNASDKLDERVKTFFQTARKQKLQERDCEYESIRKDYYKILDNADEKVIQANQLYELVDRYLRKLDHELHKFKMELEADNAGITEILEKRSLELDAHEREGDRDHHSQKENRYVSGQVVIKSEKKTERKNSYEKAGTSGFTTPYIAGGTAPPTLAYNLGHMGAGGNAIAAAASQAIAATQQMQQGRRTASLKASYDAVNLGLQTAEFSVGRELLYNAELHHAAQQALAATTSDRSGAEFKRNKRKSQHSHNQELVPVPQEEIPDEPVLAMESEAAEWYNAADSNEPRYCLCNEISYGDMVACDNASCPIEWYHYNCVGIVTPPKGKWYCPQCSASMKRRGRQPR